VPISTIPSKWLKVTNKEVSTWVSTNEQVAAAAAAAAADDKALVAQLAERGSVYSLQNDNENEIRKP